MRPVADNEDLMEVPPGYRGVSEKFKSNGEMTMRAAELAAVIIEDPIYLDKLLDRAQNGTLPPAIEKMLWEYRFGRPMEMGKMKTSNADLNALGDLSLEELSEMAAKNAEDAQILIQARARKMGVSILQGGRPS